jgi:hypothetical protein
MSNNEESYIVKLTDETTVTIGRGHKETNKVVVEVTNKTKVSKIVRLFLKVKCGTSADALLASKDAPATFEYQGPSDSKTIAGDETHTNEKGIRTWETKSTGIEIKNGATITLSFTQFESNTPPGEVVLTIGIRVFLPSKFQWMDEDKGGKKLKKIAEKKDAPTIHYFTVNPDYILHAGQTDVTVSFYATGYENIVLFRNNEEAKVWPRDEVGIGGEVADKPSITSVYRLEGKYRLKDKPDEDKREILYRTVQVISPGWNRLVLPQGYPTRLFVANDFSTGRGDRLYGIFVNAEGQAGLYSSATGVDPWRTEQGNDEFPQHMQTSPGVAYKNKLWLIGGSSVYPTIISNEVWCYEKDESTGDRGWVEQKDINLNDMPKLMGHCCIVFKGELFVIGGYAYGTVFDDVWKLEEASDGKLEWTKHLEGGGTIWDGRCMFTAVAYKNPESEKEELWIYGGVDSPMANLRFTDLWSTTDGKTWEKMIRQGYELAIVPNPGEPVGAALITSPDFDQSGGQNAGVQPAHGERLFLVGSFRSVTKNQGGTPAGLRPSLGNIISSYMFEWQPGHKVWEARPVSNGWQQFRGNTFYMQAVPFNRFIFVWSLHRNIESTLKLNVLIPT